MAFVHKPLTGEQLKRRSEQKSQIVDPAINPKFGVFRPKVGKNYIRIMEATWDNAEGFAYTIYLHRNVGSDNSAYLCLARHLREPCPICEEVKALDAEGDSEAGKQIYARKVSVMWILDRNDQEKGPQIWICGYTIEQDICDCCFHPKTGQAIDIIDPDNGFDVSFRRGNEKPYPKTGGIVIDRDPSPIDDDPKWQEYYIGITQKNPIPDVLQYYEYDHIYGVLHGRTAASARRAPKEETEGRSTSRRAPLPDNNDEDVIDRAERGRAESGTVDIGKPQGRRAPPPDDNEDTGENPDGERTPRGRRAAPEPEPEDERPARRRTQEELEPEEPRRASRRQPPPNDEPEERPTRSNGSEDTVTQGRNQIRSLRERSETDEDKPQGRRQAPPEDDTTAPRRRPSR